MINKSKEKTRDNSETGLEIAVIGMAGRFPGAENIDQFWNNLKNGVESVSFYSDRELEELGVAAQSLQDPNFVKSGGALLEDKEFFDAFFFGYTPGEAEVMDPQMRVFHECLWEALENAGYNPGTYNGSIGLYAGVGSSFYWEALVLLSGKGETLGDFAAMQLASANFLCTRISYNFNLKGPAVSVQTACSTSLVAIHTACRVLLTGECKIALAGGVTIGHLGENGYIYQEGMIASPDGHCRAFDARAEGTVGGKGAGAVVLKPLKAAVADRDHIYAVIKGSAVNNDGNRKVGYSAPSIKAQAEVIRTAQLFARVERDSITYIETHGTGTPLGDPVEVEALIKAFKTDKREYCAIGSVKTNIGHLDSAAGVASFIKTVLALKHRLIPPSLNFEIPNPKIDFKNSPFYVNTEAKEWKNENYPRRAGVSSFGIGGTNAHVVLEEAPEDRRQKTGDREQSQKLRQYQLILLSAKTPSALERMTANLAEYFKNNLLNHGNHVNPINPGQNPGINLADAAYTLQVGRKAFQYRRMLICSEGYETIAKLSDSSTNSRGVYTFCCKNEEKSVIFMFPGLGGQYPGMGQDLYRTEPVFQQEMDRGFEILEGMIDFNIKEILYPGNPTSRENPAPGARRPDIHQVEIAQPLIFLFEYALAKLLLKWGIKPDAMIGYSFGEYTAACLAGVISLEDTLKLIVIRGQLIESLPAGSMMSVPLSEKELKPFIDGAKISIAIDNGLSCIVSGSEAAIDAFEKQMKEKRILCLRLQSSRAIHSQMMDPILGEFEKKTSQIILEKPRIPYISNVTGKWITVEQATHPGYWAKHLRATVRFADGIEELKHEPNAIFLEIGPGQDLSALAARYIDSREDQQILNLIRPSHKKVSDTGFLLRKIGQLWLYGGKIDWSAFYSDKEMRRIPLPTYHFEGQPYWINGKFSHNGARKLTGHSRAGKKSDIANWFYIPSWKRSPMGTHTRMNAGKTGEVSTAAHVLVFVDNCGLGSQLAKRMEQRGKKVIVVKAGRTFYKEKENVYLLNPGDDSHYGTLFKELGELNRMPGMIIHLWNVTKNRGGGLTGERLEEAQNLGFYSLINIVQAMGRQITGGDIRLEVMGNNLLDVTGEEDLCPEKSTLLGAVKVIPHEYPHIHCRCLDIVLEKPGSKKSKSLIDQLLVELLNESAQSLIAYRGNQRWVQTFEPIRLEKPQVAASQHSRLREEGIYLILGGLGGIGLELAEYLAKTVKAKLILVSHRVFPAREEWEDWLASHDDRDVVGSKIRKLQKIETLGGELLILSADAADKKQMQEVINQTKKRFGTINGVIHSAGRLDSGVIERRTRETLENIFAPKVKGTLIIDSVLKGITLDFFIICSSLNSFIGGPGIVAHVATSNFVDAYAKYKSSRNNRFTVSVNWHGWQEVGMAVEAGKRFGGNDESQDNWMLPVEGTEAFGRILDLEDRIAQVAVSTGDLKAMYEDFDKSAPASFTPVPGKPTSSNVKFQRPQLSTDYVEPGNKLEQLLANIWEKFFGIEKIGIHDDFFELGGDSLKGMMLVNEYSELLGEIVHITVLFNATTIAELGLYFSEHYPQALARLIGQEITPGEESITRRLAESFGCKTMDRKTGSYTPIEPVEKKEYYPLSSAQKRLYILQQLDPGGTGYNMPWLIPLTGDIHRKRLENTFVSLIKRHESLRTSFIIINEDEEPVQRVHDHLAFEIEKPTVMASFVGPSPTQVPEEIVMAFVRPFDLSRAPLLRVGFIKIGSLKYVLMVDMHHIISDGFSPRILERELLQLYQDGGKILMPLRIQYKDYSEWQNRQKEKNMLKEQEKFWLKEFEGDIPVLNLPIDYKRPVLQSFEGNSLFFEIGSSETRALKGIALEQGATLFMVLLAIYTILIARITNQEDIIIGTPTAGRNHPGLEHIIGMFVNTLALRNFPKGEKFYNSFVKEVKKRVLGAFENQSYQFDDLVGNIAVNRDTSRNPVFDVAFSYQMFDDASWAGAVTAEDAGDSTREKRMDIHETSKFDMTLTVVETRGKLVGLFEYCSRLFKEETIKRFITYFKNIASSVVENTAKKIFEIEIISNVEKKRLLFEYNSTEVPYPQRKTIQDLFQVHVVQTPHHVALIGRSTERLDRKHYLYLTYGKLNDKANQLVKILKGKGPIAGKEIIVAMLLERSLEVVVGILGIIKAGAAYLPIDTEYPTERINYMLTDSGANLLLTTKKDANKITFSGHIIYLEDIEIFTTEHKNPEFPINSNSLAYIIYTSGTTGKPKGVMIEHKNVVRLLFNDKNLFDFSSNDNWTMFHSYCFDFSVWEMYGSLLYGGNLIIISRMETRNPEEFLKILKRYAITVLNQTPSAFHILANEEEKCKGKELVLRYVIFGGEALRPGILKNWKDKYPTTKLINMYGITETTVHVTYKEIKEKEISLNISNIGKPIPTLSNYIMDDGLMLLPVGVPGELCVGGEGVGRGYLNRVELTDTKFVKNPYKPKERLYRSGDISKWFDDGDMLYMGRLDRQIELRGFRIEPGEIDSNLLNYKEIKEAVTVARVDGSGDTYLCAYIVSDSPLQTAELRDYLGKKLPHHMVPSYFVQIDRIPLTPNGKINGAALPDPEIIETDHVVPPANKIQEKLLNIWQAVLEQKKLGIRCNFFNCGGDSIKAIKLLNLINAAFHSNLKIPDLYLNETIEKLSKKIIETGTSIYSGEEPDQVCAQLEKLKNKIMLKLSSTENIEDIYPMSDIEKGMVYHYLKGRENAVFHDQFTFQMRYNDFDESVLKRALELLVAKHQILRTSFNVNDYEEPVQLAHKKIPLDIAHDVISHLEPPGQEKFITKFLEEDRKKSFIVENPPLWRMRTFDRGSGNICVLWIFHHAILDGWSNAYLMTELNNTYLKLKTDPQYLPGKLNCSYRDFVIHQLFEKKNEEVIDFWKKELDDYKRPVFFETRWSDSRDLIKHHFRFLGKPLLDKLKTTARKNNTSVKHLCAAAFIYLINLLSYHNDVIIGLITNNRPLCEDGDKIIGCFLNMVPLRIKIPAGLTWAEYFKSVDKKMLTLKKYDRLSFYEIVKIIGEKVEDRNPLFDVSFNFIDFHVYRQAEEAVLPGDRQKNSHGDLNIEGYENLNDLLHFDISTTSDIFTLTAAYNARIFSDLQIENFCGYFEKILGKFINEPDSLVKKDAIIQTEPGQMLSSFNEDLGNE
jgi:amino acid adenylation domain-containing protein